MQLYLIMDITSIHLQNVRDEIKLKLDKEPHDFKNEIKKIDEVKKLNSKEIEFLTYINELLLYAVFYQMDIDSGDKENQLDDIKEYNTQKMKFDKEYGK